MSRIPEQLPAALSERLSLASQAIYTRLGREVDVAVGGIPFLLATSSEVPQSVETIPVRKDQTDVERDPGEQSLSGWWRRSQASFHQGAGFKYEPESDDPHNGFWDSRDVEVFEQGQLTLLPAVNQVSETEAWSRLRPYLVSGTRTNYCPNPSLESNATGWTAGPGATIARSTVRASLGVASLELTTTGTNNQLVDAPISTLGVGAQATMSLRVWVPTGAPGLTIVSNFNTGAVSTVEGNWQTISLTATYSFGAQLQIQAITPPAAGVKYYVDCCLIEEGGTLGAYFDGSSTGAAWTGTTNNSTSTLTITSGSKKYSGVYDGIFQIEGRGSATTHAPAGKTIVDGLVSNANFYDIASDGTLYQGSTSAPGSATSWPCGNTTSRLAWGKHRLWVIGGRRIWQPNLAAAGGTAQSAVFTHPNLGWTYTCMAEGPAAMFFGGHDGMTSTIQAITFDSGGGLPTLSGAAISAALPDGELVQELAVVAGQYLGIGTTAGFRVGVVQDNTITYGPLIIEPAGVKGTTALISEGRFFLVAFETGDGLSQVYKVDTSVDLGDGVFAYAKDMQCKKNDGNDVPYKGTIVSLASGPNGLIAAASPGLYEEDATKVCSSGYLESSRIRFRTTEPKSYKFVDVDIEPLVGAIQLEVILEGGTAAQVGSFTQQGEISGGSLALGTEPMRYLSVRITLTPNGGLTEGPVLHSYLVRAMPAVAPQRLITLPLMCYDREQARSGQRYGGDGYASDRLIALQQLESGGKTLIYQDFTSGNDTGYNVVIEGIKYVQLTPRNSEDANMGGILYLQLRTADA